VQSTRKITKAMELIAASQISRSQARIIANRPYRNGMRRIIVEAAKADPAGAAKLLATPEHVDCAIVLVLTGDRGLSGAYNSSAMRAGERLVRKLEDDGTSVRLFSVGKKAGAFYRFRGIDLAEGFVGMSDQPDLRRRSSHRRDRRGAVRLGRGPTGALGLDALLVLGHPKRRSGAVATLAMPDLVERRGTEGLEGLQPSSNLRSPNSSRRSRPRPSRARSSQHS